MAQIDTWVKAMLERPGSEIRMVADAMPELVLNGQHYSIYKQALSGAQIQFLLDEMLPPPARGSLETHARAAFQYAAPGLETVRITIREWGGAVNVRVVPAAAGPAAAPEPRRPAGPAAAPKAAGASKLPAAMPENPHPDEPRINMLFREMVRRGASDLHLATSEQPMLRHDGEMARIESWPFLSGADVSALIDPITPAKYSAQFKERHDADFAYEIEGLARFRCNRFLDRKGPGGVFRVIPAEILTVEQLGLSKHIQQLCFLTKGLVLVTGPTGSGKSTTLCALVDLINRTRKDHVITIEDPIEFVHENKKCLVNQREVGEHTMGFKEALRAALREDPDIVLVGEMRDLETIAIAIETAETGHLVFGTLHTSTAASTVDRIIDQFPADRQGQIRVMLSESLKGVISQTLCKKIGGGRIAAMEVLIGSHAVSNLIREGKTFQLPSIMQTARNKGMVLLNAALMELVEKKLVEPKEAYMKSIDKAGLLTYFKNANIPTRFLADPTAGASA